MADRRAFVTFLRGAFVAGMVIGLSGCADGVELQGGIFDALGVSGKSGKASEPKVARRNGLIVPPNTGSLPAPGSGGAAGTAVDATGQASPGQQWPRDPKDLKIARAAQEKQIISKYCSEADWWKRSNPAEFGRMTQDGALCESSLSKIIKKNTH